MMNIAQNQSQGSAKVRLLSDRVIECVLEGDITGPIVRQSVDETGVFVNAVRTKGLNPRLIIDMSSMKSQDSNARSEAKRLARMGFEKVAITGAKGLLGTVGQYIVQITGMQSYTRFFRLRARADAWIKEPVRRQGYQKSLAIKLASVLVGVIGIGVFAGWLLNSEYLVAIVPGMKPMNPVTALNFILLSVAMLAAVAVGKFVFWRKPLVYIIAVWLGVYGVLVFLGYAAGINSGIDAWLFSGRLETIGAISAKASVWTGFLFFLSSLSLVFIVSEFRKPWQLFGYRLVSLLALLTLIRILIGNLFGFTSFVQITTTTILPVPVPTLIAFMIALPTLVAFVYTPDLFPIFRRMLRTYWAGIVVFSMILILTSVVWRQTTASIELTNDLQAQRTFDKATTTIESRVDAYVNALHGYRAFFESSSEVTAEEFDSYYQVSDVAKNYPGLNTISLVRFVKNSDLKTFEGEIRAQNSTHSLYKNFKVITPARGNHYVVTFIQPLDKASSMPGFDLSSLAGRSVVYEAARESGEARASGVVAFTTNGKNENGFLITMPVYRAGTDLSKVESRRDNIFGFVNTTFRNDVIFTDIFKEMDLEKGVAFRLTTSDGALVHDFRTTAEQIDFTDTRFKGSIDVVGQKWSLEMQTDRSYGLSSVAGTASTATLIGGLGLATLAAFLVVSLSRRRQQALVLASTMTEDLNNERNIAEGVRQKDDAILASIGDAVFAVDLGGLVTLFNPAASELTGFTEKEALGKHYSQILPFVSEKTGKIDSRFIDRALEGKGGSMKADMMLRRRNGATVAVADSAAPIRNLDKEIIGAIVVFRDVSKERELDKAKAEFVSLASHQLRTPLSAINWYSEMLLNGDAGKLSEDQLEYMAEIYEGNKRMVELVDSLLNVSRLEVGRLKNEPQDTSLVELANSLEKEMQTSIIAKHMNMHKKIAKHLPVVFADPKLLRMIIQNLLSNAVKYTPPKGDVTLTMRLAKTEELAKARLKHNQQYVFISVADTGYGIPVEQQDKIFEKLFRADNVRKMDVEGTGLGLYIIKEVAKKLGGTIWFESKESLGTTFYVIIPVKTRKS